MRAAVLPLDRLHHPRATVLALENTHNQSGGTVWPLVQLEEVVETGRGHDLAVHLDGARIANAAVALGIPAARIGGLFDTVTLCLSKGLGCPLGALLAGSSELMALARVEKHRAGGAMRQAGIVAAAGAEALAGVRVATIGPVTSKTARGLGLEIAAEAHPFIIDGLVNAILGLFHSL